MDCSDLVRSKPEIITHPMYCELWQSTKSKKEFLILANCLSEDESSIWAFDIKSEEMCHVPINDLTFLSNYGFEQTSILCKARAEKGCSDSMWWLGWANEGTNHPKSVWYYIAALRANPKKHSWAFGRILADSRYAAMCKGTPAPCLKFLDNIYEFINRKIFHDWKAAVDTASVAIHKPE